VERSTARCFQAGSSLAVLTRASLFWVMAVILLRGYGRRLSACGAALKLWGIVVIAIDHHHYALPLFPALLSPGWRGPCPARKPTIDGHLDSLTRRG
jgi:hypothetical protein